MARIVIATREPNDGVPRHLALLGVELETRLLYTGDYGVGDQALGERKTVRGLHAAIIKGTFWPQCVPGISSHHARLLLARFGTLAAVAQADREEWLQVSGIGATRAKALETV